MHLQDGMVARPKNLKIVLFIALFLVPFIFSNIVISENNNLNNLNINDYNLTYGDFILRKNIFQNFDFSIDHTVEKVIVIAYYGDFIPDEKDRDITNYYRWEYNNGIWIDQSGHDEIYIKTSECKKEDNSYNFCIKIDNKAKTGRWNIKVIIDEENEKGTYNFSLQVFNGFNFFLTAVIGVFEPLSNNKKYNIPQEIICSDRKNIIKTSEKNINKLVDKIITNEENSEKDKTSEKCDYCQHFLPKRVLIDEIEKSSNTIYYKSKFKKTDCASSSIFNSKFSGGEFFDKKTTNLNLKIFTIVFCLFLICSSFLPVITSEKPPDLGVSDLNDILDNTDSKVNEDKDIINNVIRPKLHLPKRVADNILKEEKVKVIFRYNDKNNFKSKISFLEDSGFIKTSEISSEGLVAGYMDISVYNKIKFRDDSITVYDDNTFSIFLDESLPIIRFNDAFDEFGLTGSGKKICILDTGVDSSLVDYSYGYDFVNDDNIPEDGNGHGTKVASVIKSIAPDCELIVAKVLDSNGEGYESTVLEGLIWCIAQDPDVISFSIGTKDTCDGFCDSNLVASMCNDAVDNGIFVIAASGNDGEQALTGPACGSRVFSVGATDNYDNIAGFSNVNPTLDCFAPGVDITTDVGTGSGTSMSAPFVAGTALLVLENEFLDPVDLKYRLRSTGKPISYTYNESLSLNISRLDIYNMLSNSKTMEPYDYSGWWQGELSDFKNYGTTKTTVSFLADGGDGVVAHQVTGLWATCHDAVTGTTVDTKTADYADAATVSRTGTTPPSTWGISRYFAFWDTSSLPDDCTITGAYIHVDGWTCADSAVIVQESTWDTTSSLGTADYDSFTGSSFGIVDPWTTNADNNFTLNAAGYGSISKTHHSEFCFRESTYDYGNVAPKGNGYWRNGIRSANQFSSGLVPALYVTYTTNSAPTNGAPSYTWDDTDDCYAQHKWYFANVTYTDTDGASDFNYVEIRFYEGFTTFAEFRYAEANDTAWIKTGDDKWDLDGGVKSWESGDNIDAVWKFKPQWDATEATNVDVQLYCVDDSSASDSDSSADVFDVITDLVTSSIECNDANDPDRVNIGASVQVDFGVRYETEPSSGSASSFYPPDSEFTSVSIYDSSNNNEGTDSTIVKGDGSVTFNAPGTVGSDTYNLYIDMADDNYTDGEETTTETIITDRVEVTNIVVTDYTYDGGSRYWDADTTMTITYTAIFDYDDSSFDGELNAGYSGNPTGWGATTTRISEPNDYSAGTVVTRDDVTAGSVNSGGTYGITSLTVSATTPEVGWDGEKPSSSIDTITSYTQTSSEITLNSTDASDGSGCGLKNVTLWYRWSSDNSSWGSWMENITDSTFPHSWSFSFPNSTGYYEFYSIAGDNVSNIEDAPGSNDTMCYYTAGGSGSNPPVINSYDLKNCSDGDSKLNNATGSLDVNHDYNFMINITDSDGWGDVKYINITAWYDAGSETSTYNQTLGGNINMFLQYENTTGTANYALLWPDDEAQIISGNCTETIINANTRVINISFKPGLQTRWAGGDGSWDATQNTTNDANSWNFNVTVSDENDIVWKVGEYGVYKYTSIQPDNDWVDVLAVPGSNDVSSIVTVTYSSNYDFNMTIYFEENLENTLGSNIISIANNVYIMAITDPDDDITTDMQFQGIGEVNAIDIFNDSGLFQNNGTSQTVQVQFDVHVPFGTSAGKFVARVATKITQD